MSERPMICDCECGGRHCASNRVSARATRNLPPRTERQIAESHSVSRAREATVQSETSVNAVAKGARWTAEEDEAVMDRSHSNEEIAHRIGRTYWAVHSRRKRLYREAVVRDDG